MLGGKLVCLKEFFYVLFKLCIQPIINHLRIFKILNPLRSEIPILFAILCLVAKRIPGPCSRLLNDQ